MWSMLLLYSAVVWGQGTDLGDYHRRHMLTETGVRVYASVPELRVEAERVASLLRGAVGAGLLDEEDYRALFRTPLQYIEVRTGTESMTAALTRRSLIVRPGLSQRVLVDLARQYWVWERFLARNTLLDSAVLSWSMREDEGDLEAAMRPIRRFMRALSSVSLFDYGADFGVRQVLFEVKPGEVSNCEWREIFPTILKVVSTEEGCVNAAGDFQVTP